MEHRDNKKRRRGSGSMHGSPERKTQRARSPEPQERTVPTPCGERKERIINFAHVPCNKFILDAKTEPLESVYKVGKVLGEGQFGIVSEVVNHQTGISFACKSIAKESLRFRFLKRAVIQEIRVLSSLKGDPMVVSLESVHEDRNWIHIVMELCSGGDLLDAILSKSQFPENLSAQIFEQVVRGVVNCHERRIMHRDLKPENVLLVKPCDGMELPRVKLADFGLSKRLTPGKKTRGEVGSAFYMAPEVWESEYDFSADVWSLGVVLFVLLSGTFPFSGEDDLSIRASIQANNPKFEGQPWDSVSEEAKSLIREILNSEAYQRPTARELLEHPWVLKHRSCFASTSTSTSSFSENVQSPAVDITSEDLRVSPQSASCTFQVMAELSFSEWIQKAVSSVPDCSSPSDAMPSGIVISAPTQNSNENQSSSNSRSPADEHVNSGSIHQDTNSRRNLKRKLPSNFDHPESMKKKRSPATSPTSVLSCNLFL